VRVLSVTHGPSVPGGVFDEVVEAAGYELERWVVPLGSAPRSPDRYGAVMIFGGSMHPDQDEQFPWLASEATFLRAVLDAGIPALGVCLGAQMLARAAGAAVAPSSQPEVGWYEVELTRRGREDPVIGALPPRAQAFQWHHYTFDLPNGAEELARSAICTQAFRVDNAWAIQFHAEVTEAMLDAWLDEAPEDVPDPDLVRKQTKERIAGWNELGRTLCGAFLRLAEGPGQSLGSEGSRDHSCQEPT
jgi:GMP synthase (glutamine-hydrolysing)